MISLVCQNAVLCGKWIKKYEHVSKQSRISINLRKKPPLENIMGKKRQCWESAFKFSVSKDVLKPSKIKILLLSDISLLSANTFALDNS